MNRADSELILFHFLGQPIYLLTSVAEDDCLCDGQGVVQIAECIEFPLFLLDGNEKLTDTLCSKRAYAIYIEKTHTLVTFQQRTTYRASIHLALPESGLGLT